MTRLIPSQAPGAKAQDLVSARPRERRSETPRACSHLWFSRGFTRPPGTSTRNCPREPTTSKPCRPQGLCSSSIVEVDGSVHAELRRGGDRRGSGRGGGGGSVGRQGPEPRHR